MLQICMRNDDQATFVFMKPGASREELIADRELVKETLQQNLTRHRQAEHEVCDSNLAILFSNFRQQ